MSNNNLIWYVCYGSNLCLNRFMCYLTGDGNDKYNIQANSKRKCNDQTPPIDSRIIEIPFELYFARESRTWKEMGVCFIDPNKKSKTVGRAYLITEKQYEHIWCWEGKNNWYPIQIELGEIDGVKAVTFTAASRNIPDKKPCDLYYQVVRDGLIECGLSCEEADYYLKKRIKDI